MNPTFKNTQETFNGTRNLAQQDIYAPSHFINKEIIETMPKTTQHSFSPIHPVLTTPHDKNTPIPQTTIQSRVKSSATSKIFTKRLPNK